MWHELFVLQANDSRLSLDAKKGGYKPPFFNRKDFEIPIFAF